MEPMQITNDEVVAELASSDPAALERAVLRVGNRKMAERIGALEAELAERPISPGE